MRYVILLPGDEAAWEQAGAAERTAGYALHDDFRRRLAEGGHTVLGGAELAPSRTAKTLVADADGITVTDGPYAEVAEQLTGFYEVESADLDDLVQACAVLAGPAHQRVGAGRIEVRAVIDTAQPDAS